MIDKNKYAVLKSAIEKDIDDLRILTEEMADIGLFPAITVKSIGSFDLNSSYACRLVGTFLADYYEGIENISKRIAKSIDGYVPSGHDWHKELIEQVCRELSGKRPVVFSEETHNMINKFRRFRHVFRAKYGYLLQSKTIYENVMLLNSINNNLKADIFAFIEKMDILVGIHSEK